LIAKHIPMRSQGKSDFAGLATYITSEQNKTERLGQIRAANCQADTMQAVIGEVLATQQQNTRAQGDKTFHLLISFRPGEKPSADTLKAVEGRFCAGLGYAEHQRISAAHHDTDNVHIHIAINKIHPTHLTMHEPFQFYRTLGDLCENLETEFGLEPDNHQTKRSLAEGRAADMEQHAGVESLVGWIRRECLNDIQGAQSWCELHQVLSENGLELRQRANGFVIVADDGTMVKASTVARDLSKPKLEARLGPFEASSEQQQRIQARRQYKKRPVRSRINTVELYAQYQNEQRSLTTTRASEWVTLRGRKDRQINAAKRSNRLRRAAIKLMVGTRFAKKVLYAQAHKALQKEVKRVNKQYQKERKALYSEYQRRAWADWLKQKALEGDKEALAALRAREAATGLKGDTITGEGQARPGHATVATDNITKKGTIIYRAGTSAVRDDGDKLQVSRDATHESVQAALRLAMERYGHRITVNGSATFKAQVIHAAVTSQLPITFADPALERWRQQSILNNQENKHEQSQRTIRSGRQERGRADRRGNGQAGSNAATNQHATRAGTNHKPNVGGVGRVPPPQSQHRLRTLSELGVVQLASGSEVLLPRDVPRHVEQQGTQPINELRRRVFGPRVSSKQVAAADRYIAEREEKRLKSFDIPKHTRYTGQNCSISYAGIRNIEGQTLALLKHGDEIMVLPVDQATAQRMKRVTIGDPVTVTALGSIKTSKGRGR